MTLRTALLASAILATMLAPPPIRAAVTAQEAQQLKGPLTPVGAERAGSGAIPAWTGGDTTAPPGLGPTSPLPDMFANDRLVLSINASNADSYASKLPAGALFMLKNYRGFRIDVYPTHRTAGMPQSFYNNTFANATRATLTSDQVSGAYGGVPFPIPKTGEEAIWNNNLAWHGIAYQRHTANFIVPPGDGPILSSRFEANEQWPYFYPGGSPTSYHAIYYMARSRYAGPPNRVGEELLAWNTDNEDTAAYEVWQYLTGQRRLRKAPNVAYDGSYPDCSGLVTVDEILVFNGRTDRYNMTLLGKREMYVPYNDNKMYLANSGTLYKPYYLAPDKVRWELHRVWAVELDLKPGKRHVISKRVVYLDEDTWQALYADEYDDQGRLYKFNTSYPLVDPMIPGVIADTNVIYDLQSGAYCSLNGGLYGDGDNPYIPVSQRPSSFFQPDSVAAEAAR